MSILEVLTLFCLCLIPGLEPRYVVLLGLAKGYSLLTVLAITLTSTVILALLLSYAMPLIDKLMNYLQGTYLRKVSELYFKYVNYVRRRSYKYASLGLVGIILFIAIPVPATGMWTGAILGHLLGLNRCRMFLSLLLGGIASQLIVLLTGYLPLLSLLKIT